MTHAEKSSISASIDTWGSLRAYDFYAFAEFTVQSTQGLSVIEP
ncbi:hypothetical protein ACVMB2_003432 [Sinorhizobium meliloti]